MCIYVNYHESKELKEDYNISILVTKKYNMSIWCFPTIDNIHMNVYHEKMSTSDKCARISLLEPKYIIANDSDIPHWNLSDNDKNNLISILRSKNDSGFFKKKASTYWEFMILSINNEFGYDALPEDLPMPNYMELK